MLASEFITQSRFLLFDPTPGAGWSDDELLGYLNDGVRQTCFVKPEAYTIVAAVVLAVGIVQTIPTAGHALLDVMFNTASGNAITQVDKALMEAADPTWGAIYNRTTEIEHYTADPRNPLRFYVYPGAASGANVTLLYGAVPAALSLGSTIALPDAYIPTLQDYVQSRAFSKPSQRMDLQKAAVFKQQWGAALGLKSQAQVMLSPKIVDGTPT